MAAAATFDTLATTRALEAAGVERKQAEAHAEALASAVRESRGGVAAKSDLDTGLANLRADLYRAMWIQAGAIVAALTAIAGIAIALTGLFAGSPA